MAEICQTSNLHDDLKLKILHQQRQSCIWNFAWQSRRTMAAVKYNRVIVLG